MSTPAATLAETCPECAAPLEADPRYPFWCPACEWNLLNPPKSPDHRSTSERRREQRSERRTEARKRAVRARAEKVYELLMSDAPSSRDTAWLGAVALAGLVHLATLTLLVGSVTLVAVPDSWPVRVLCAIGLVLTYMLRPRLGKTSKGPDVVDRSDAPALYALADRVAAAAGTKPVHTIKVSGRFNASFARRGLRRRTELEIGLPLWVALAPQQRISLLGHEFGHDANGDHRRGLWLNSAIQALNEWCLITRPGRRRRLATGLAMLANLVERVAMRVLNLVAYGLLTLLDRLTTRSGQAAEHRADLLAARIGSTSAAKSMLETLMLGLSLETVLTRRRSSRQGRRPAAATQKAPAQGLWTEIAEQLASVPPLERERRLRLSARELSAVDSSHPPTYLRIRLLDQRPAVDAALVLDEDEAAAIEAELAPYRERIGRELEEC